MHFLSRRQLRKKIDVDLIVNAINEAEGLTSGEIKVSIAPFFWGNVRRAAEKTFVRLSMSRTKERNGILFFIVPSRRKFAILGDSGIHTKVGQEFWQSLAELLTEHFRKKEFTTGLVKAINQVGLKLAEHFPYEARADINELSDEVDFAEK